MRRAGWLVGLTFLVAASAEALTGEQLAVVVDRNQPLSVRLGAYYRQAHDLPPANLIEVSIPKAASALGSKEFSGLKQEIDRQLPAHIQAVLFAWTQPYKVDCVSFTSAYTLGFDAAACANTCAPGKASAYFDAASKRPWDHYGIRPSMLLPALTFEQGKALIDRGVASVGSSPANADAYLLVTRDKARSSRAITFPRSTKIDKPPLDIHTLSANEVAYKSDILFYLTGLVSVPKLDTLRFLPGALADHLTSFGGDLLGRSQMSSLRWLEAGATASYGTVSEPCNYPQKFPHAGVLIKHYLSGETAIESYWKSVSWAAQGLFIGDPLAAPYVRKGSDNF